MTPAPETMKSDNTMRRRSSVMTSDNTNRRRSSTELRRSAMEKGTTAASLGDLEKVALTVQEEESSQTKNYGMVQATSLISLAFLVFASIVHHSFFNKQQAMPKDLQTTMFRSLVDSSSPGVACTGDSDCLSDLCVEGTCKATFFLFNLQTGNALDMTGRCVDGEETHMWAYQASIVNQKFFEHEGRVHPYLCGLSLALEVSTSAGPWCGSGGRLILATPNNGENQKIKLDDEGKLVPYGTGADGQVCSAAFSIPDQSSGNGAKIALIPRDSSISNYQVFKDPHFQPSSSTPATVVTGQPVAIPAPAPAPENPTNECAVSGHSCSADSDCCSGAGNCVLGVCGSTEVVGCEDDSSIASDFLGQGIDLIENTLEPFSDEFQKAFDDMGISGAGGALNPVNIVVSLLESLQASMALAEQGTDDTMLNAFVQPPTLVCADEDADDPPLTELSIPGCEFLTSIAHLDVVAMGLSNAVAFGDVTGSRDDSVCFGIAAPVPGTGHSVIEAIGLAATGVVEFKYKEIVIFNLNGLSFSPWGSLEEVSELEMWDGGDPEELTLNGHFGLVGTAVIEIGLGKLFTVSYEVTGSTLWNIPNTEFLFKGSGAPIISVGVKVFGKEVAYEMNLEDVAGRNVEFYVGFVTPDGATLTMKTGAQVSMSMQNLCEKEGFKGMLGILCDVLELEIEGGYQAYMKDNRFGMRIYGESTIEFSPRNLVDKLIPAEPFAKLTDEEKDILDVAIQGATFGVAKDASDWIEKALADAADALSDAMSDGLFGSSTGSISVSLSLEVELGGGIRACASANDDTFCSQSCNSNSDCGESEYCSDVLEICMPKLGQGGICFGSDEMCLSNSCLFGIMCVECKKPLSASDECGDGKFCDFNLECKPQVDLGVMCGADAACKSGKCGGIDFGSVNIGVCSVPCNVDSDCSGENYCENILENKFCTPKKQNGLLELCDRDSVCTSGVCNGFHCSECRSELDGSLCDSGKFCDVGFTCNSQVANGTPCGTDAACHSGYCSGLSLSDDVTVGTCQTHCDNDNDCGNNQFCELGNFCTNQKTNSVVSICDRDRVCTSGVCNGFHCSECRGDNNCHENEFCEIGGICEGRKDSGFGQFCNRGRVCKSNRCDFFCIGDSVVHNVMTMSTNYNGFPAGVFRILVKASTRNFGQDYCGQMDGTNFRAAPCQDDDDSQRFYFEPNSKTIHPVKDHSLCMDMDNDLYFYDCHGQRNQQFEFDTLKNRIVTKKWMARGDNDPFVCADFDERGSYNIHGHLCNDHTDQQFTPDKIYDSHYMDLNRVVMCEHEFCDGGWKLSSDSTYDLGSYGNQLSFLSVPACFSVVVEDGVNNRAIPLVGSSVGHTIWSLHDTDFNDVANKVSIVKEC